MATTKKKTETINSKEGLENIKLVDKEKELLKEKLASQEKEMSDLKAQMEMLLKSLFSDLLLNPLFLLFQWNHLKLQQFLL